MRLESERLSLCVQRAVIAAWKKTPPRSELSAPAQGALVLRRVSAGLHEPIRMEEWAAGSLQSITPVISLLKQRAYHELLHMRFLQAAFGSSNKLID